MTVSAPTEPDYTTLPERDLMARPYTESPGLEAATSVVGRKEIEDLHAYSVVDAMKYVPGAWTETRGRKVKSFYSVRGQRYPYPGYLIDGPVDVDLGWFSGDETVAISAGASAPESVVQECVALLQEKFEATVESRTIREEEVRFALPKPLRDDGNEQ